MNREHRKEIIKNLNGLIPNTKGGWKVKTIISLNDFEIFRTLTKGLYAWCYESELDGILKTGYGPIKFGQYGTDTLNGILPQNTIESYNWSAGNAVVILWVYPFSTTDFLFGTPKSIEQKINKRIGVPVKDGWGQEIWITSIETIENELKKEFNKSKLLTPFISSDDKEIAITKMIENRSKYFGLFATMRHGKSWDYLEYIKRKYVNNTLVENHIIFCHDTKTYGGWKKKVQKSYEDCIDLIELKDNKEYDFSKTPIKNTIVLISPQLISASSNGNGDINFEEKIKSLQESYKITAENIFVDEAHNYFTSQWERYYESILGKGQIILATGTSANLILKHQDKFDETNTFIWGIKELQQKLLDELNVKLKLEVKLIQLKNTNGSDFNIANLQSSDDGVLSNQFHFEQFVDKMLNPNSKFSPIFSRERKHHIALFDTVNTAKEFKKLIQSSKYSNKIIPILVAGSTGRDANTEEDVNTIIEKAESENKRTITITCGSMIQGVSERNWKSILNLSSKSTYEIYFQLFGRGFEFDDKLDNYIGKDTKEERVIMWDYNPHRIYGVGAEFVDSMAKINGDNQETALKYFFEIIDITEYIDEQRTWSQPKTYQELENRINEIVNKNTIRRGLTINTCLDKSFTIEGLDSKWAEWSIKQRWSNNKQDKIRKEKLDLWQKELDKQTTDHSKSQKDKVKKRVQNEVLDLYEQIKRSFEQTLNKIDIVWVVYKSEGKVKYHIDELFDYYDEDIFLKALGLPNKEISKVFVNTIKEFGLTDKINGKLKNSKIETISSFLNMDRKAFLNICDTTIDKWFNYNGDDTQLSVRNAYTILKEQIKNLKLKKGQKIHIKHAKSGALNLALTYLLYENSIKIFGKQLTKEQVIESVNFEDENTFFESLVSTMGFIKSNNSKKDFIVINPPYKGGLHIDIFNKAFDELEDGGTLICVHPSTPFINRKPTKDDGKTKRIKEIVSEYKTRLTLVDGNKIFNAGFFTPLSITKVQKVLDKNIEVIYSHIDSANKEVRVYDKLDSIFIHGNDNVLKIKNKILSKMNSSLEDNLYRNGKTSNVYYALCRFSGHPPKNGETNVNPDFFQLIYKSNEVDYSSLLLNKAREKSEQKGGNQFNDLALNDNDNVIYFHNYLLTKFARFAVSIYKISATLDCKELSSVPYMDFSQEWTDEELFKYFELDSDEIEFISKYIPNWYERDFK